MNIALSHAAFSFPLPWRGKPGHPSKKLLALSQFMLHTVRVEPLLLSAHHTPPASTEAGTGRPTTVAPGLRQGQGPVIGIN